ncbi:MAG: phosphoglucomutase/phosphomannomutase family protein [Acidobacteriales bacterium]|nr:phosphoglucomutase/phosphomannomutase family protein [Terriglobales bacterium]
MATEIKFGTDGWRGIIADDFTFENVRRVATAIAAHVWKHEHPEKGIVIGYDTRFGSRRFAEAAAQVIAATGIHVTIADDYVPTPAVSYAVKNWDASGGVVITSSHNPWNWNGVKYKAYYGGSAKPSIIRSIEMELNANTQPEKKPARITPRDFKTEYIAEITRLADLKKISQCGFKFGIDCMYGSGRGILAGIFREYGIPHVEIRAEVDPLFPGINPEPILPHVAALQEMVVREKCAAGFVTDGDADRIGAVDENGNFVDAHKVFSVLLKWLLDHKKWPGIVTRAYNTTKMIDRICKKYGREMVEHGIGFKYACDIMLEREVLIGGEESGGIGLPRHLPERDGILNALLLANVMADEGKTLGQLVAALQAEFGEHHYARLDMTISNELKRSAIERAATVERVGRFKVLDRGDLDGIKLFLQNDTYPQDADAWLLIRASGTEPLLRVYAEAGSPKIVQEMLTAADKFVHRKA